MISSLGIEIEPIDHQAPSGAARFDEFSDPPHPTPPPPAPDLLCRPCRDFAVLSLRVPTMKESVRLCGTLGECDHCIGLNPQRGWQSSCHPRERVECGSPDIFVFKPPEGAYNARVKCPKTLSIHWQRRVSPPPGALGNSKRHVPTGLHRWQADFRPFGGLKTARRESRKCILPKPPMSRPLSESWGYCLSPKGLESPAGLGLSGSKLGFQHHRIHPREARRGAGRR